MSDPVMRFFGQIEVQAFAPIARPDLDPCWLWRASTSKCGGAGYGRICVDGRKVVAHAFSYRSFVGEIPIGFELDHLCAVTLCVNPTHLEPVTHLENVLRTAARITHCPKGHPYAGMNLYVDRDGHRNCRTCARELARIKRAA